MPVFKLCRVMDLFEKLIKDNGIFPLSSNAEHRAVE
jgi:hypothetical protein